MAGIYKNMQDLEKILDQMVNKKFPVGKRKWCIECAKRIRKEVLKQCKI